MEQNHRPIENEQTDPATRDVEDPPADSSEDPATSEDFEDEGMGIAPKE